MEQIYKYKVSTLCCTYNQEKYILDALNGFVLQELPFPAVFLIVDDASTDRTADVIRDFFNANFDLEDSSVAYEKHHDYGIVTYARHKTNRNCFFGVLYLKENHYQKKPTTPYLSEWRDNAKYQAICEGDDYWTDPLKLQLQVAFMEKHPDHTMCFHAMQYLYPGGEMRAVSRYRNDVEECAIGDFFKIGGGYAPTGSMLYVRSLSLPLPSFFEKSTVGDSPLILTLFLRGKVGFSCRVMGCYRVNAVGSWSQRQKRLTFSQAVSKYKEGIAYWEEVNRYTEGKYARLVRQRKIHTCLSLGKSLFYWFCNQFDKRRGE